jgi:murein DD-endopeptidase MepM/ murein hydrolase activator NlpD
MAHKKHKSQYISFLIIPDSQNEPKTFKFKRSVVSVFVGVLIGIFALIIFGAASYWKVAEIAIDYSRLREENFKLRKSMEKINQLQTDLNQMKQIDQKIRASLNGYVSVAKAETMDSTAISDINFKKMSVEQERTIFNSIPSYTPVEGFITRGFDASSFFTDPHLGIDIAAPTGTPIKAAADGIVMFSGWTDDGGNVLIVKHEFGFSTVYKHNEYNMVSVLEKVTKGQVIALLGNTGKITSGAHLHFEVWRNDAPIDPLVYISENNSES